MKIIDYVKESHTGFIIMITKEKYIASASSTSKEFKTLKEADAFMSIYGYRKK